jgi:homoserine O-succinyltransferase
MPLELEPHLAATHGKSALGRSGAIVIGLINNMPDSALQGTEAQFAALLSRACGNRTVQLRYSSLPEVPRAFEAQRRINARYWPLRDLYANPPDALIVTGTEPKTAVLPSEPYWNRLVELLDFARTRVISSAWSCLAAHAAGLQLDGIERRRLAVKRFGVFEQRVQLGHALTRDLEPVIHIPHSRWNTTPLEALERAGYQILTRSADGDADLFVKQDRSLLLCFQGHPEYEERTLLKEYQRDVNRFINGELQDYPPVPHGCFNENALDLACQFERQVRSGDLAEPLAAFPFTALAATLQTNWFAPAATIYRNWLEHIANIKARE